MEIDAERLLFRRQFILGPQVSHGLAGWRGIEISDSVRLSVHPDLQSTDVQHGSTRIVLLGYMLDPHNPTYSDQQILDAIAERTGCFDDLISAIDNYGGRWAIVYHDGRASRIFHDACGLRQIYYMTTAGSVWCGSQPSILRHAVGNVEEDPAAIEVTQLPQYASRESSWFGDGTIYKGIRHLLPNHYLDLADGTVHRYWPRDPIGHASLDKDFVDDLAHYISGCLEAAANRFELMIPITAGWDSRVLLAASKRISSKVFYYISTMNMLPRNHQDVAVPSRLLEKLGLPFNIIDPDPEDDDQYRQIYFKNVTQARSLPKSLTIHHFFKHCQGMVNVSGNGAEIGRGMLSSFYRSLFEASQSVSETGIVGTFHYKHDRQDQFPIGPRGFATVYGFGEVDYVVNAIGGWMAECVPICSQYGLDISDMYHWEQRLGNWGAMYQAEEDIAVEVLWPFNIRALLVKMLSVEITFRRPPQYLLYRKLATHMWPKVLSEPVNPANQPSRVSRYRHAIGRRMPPFVRSCYRLLRDRIAGRTADKREPQ